MISIVRFGDESTIKSFLSNHRIFGDASNQERGITIAVAELSAARFKNSERTRDAVKLMYTHIIVDLVRGIDGFTREPLPKNLSKFGLDATACALLSTTLRMALLECAEVLS